MSMVSLQNAVLHGARKALNNPKLRAMDIIEWSTGDIDEHDGEIVVNVPDPGVFVAVDKKYDKRKAPK